MSTNTNYQNQAPQRVFTIVCREGNVLLTDSKLNANGVGSYQRFEGTNTQIECLKALNSMLIKIPRTRLNSKVVFLMPTVISFLSYKDTRTNWLATGMMKNGRVIEEEVLEQVRIMDENLDDLENSVLLFDQTKIKNPLYLSYRQGSWDVLNKLHPAQVTDVNAF